MIANIRKMMRDTGATEEEARVVLGICRRNVSEAKKLFSLYPRQIWTALARLPSDVRNKILNAFLLYFPCDVLEECLQGHSPEDCEYLSSIALRAFANRKSDAIQRDEFAQTLQQGKATILPLFQEWARELREMVTASNKDLEYGATRERFNRLLNQTLPSATEANPAFCGIMEDIINFKVPSGGEMQTALHIAAKLGDLDLVNNLLEHNAKFDTLDSHGNTALHFGIDDPSIVAALLSAAERAQQLVQFVEQGNFFRRNALHSCINVESARQLIRVRPSLVFEKDAEGTTVLQNHVNDEDMLEAFLDVAENAQRLEQYAERGAALCKSLWSCCHNADSARLLLRMSPSLLFAKDKFGNTALHLNADNLSMIEFLLDAAADSNRLIAPEINFKGETALHLCSDQDCAHLLLRAFPGAALVRCRAGNTPLHGQAMLGNQDVCRFLLEECGVDVNAANDTGQTPLHLACLVQREDVVFMLLAHSPRVLSRDYQQRTILHYALLDNDLEVNGELLDESLRGLAIDHSLGMGRANLVWLSTLGQAVVVELVAARDVGGKTALHCYAEVHPIKIDTALVDLLVLAGANAAAQDEQGDTVMHILSRKRSFALLFHLVKRWGSPIRVKNHAGKTALTLAHTAHKRSFLERASTLASIFTLRLAARPRAVPSPWKRFPRELCRELRSFLV